MFQLGRRQFLLSSSHAIAATGLRAARSGKPRVGLVASNHRKLAQPTHLKDPLDYNRIREMVFRAIEYGRPHVGSLENKIRPGSWVVIKPNIVSLRPRAAYTHGDITDMRVIKAVLEYVAGRSRAGRISIAEGGTYRGVADPLTDSVITQNGVRVAAEDFDWGDKEFPGFSGSLGTMIREARTRFPDKRIDYIDLSYDALRDASGKFRKVEVPKTIRGVGAFSGVKEYFVTNTITKCDFLINVPVMKVHLQCGITACFKNYVGTAPREAYQSPGLFNNNRLHVEHSVDGRLDPFIIDLASFHPPDYNVVCGITGLQYEEHNNKAPDQMIRSNLILAGEDPVATDALVAHLMSYNPGDIEYLHMAVQRELGTMDLAQIEVIGDDPGPHRRFWGRPRNWYGRCNREWRLTDDPALDVKNWKAHTNPTDTLYFVKWAGREVAPGEKFGAAARVRATGQVKANLWIGVQGKFTAYLNGEKVMEEESPTRYRVGQFRQPVGLRSGENLLVVQLEALTNDPRLSVLLSGPRNDGDTASGVRWMAQI